MTQSSGFMFTAKLTAGPINNNQTLVINSPDANSPNLDRVNWEVAANGYVYVDPDVRVGIGATFFNVTNYTGIPWPQHSEVVLCTPYISDPTALETIVAGHTTQLAALEPTVAGHTTQLANLTTRTGTLETTVANHGTRIAALEAAAP